MKRAFLSIFAAFSLLLPPLQSIVLGQSTRASSPATQQSHHPNEPGSERGGTHTQPSTRTAQTASPMDPAVEKIRREIDKIGIAQKITVFLNNGDTLHGAVTKIDRDEFAVAEVDFQRIFTIQYKDVKKVRSGYGGINLITGKRASPPRWARIAAPIGALFLVIGLPIIILANTKD